MADILIRKVDEEIKTRLVQKAARLGSSLEGYLRDVLAREATEAPSSNDENEPFGTWAVKLFADLEDDVREEFLRNLEEIENLPAPEPPALQIE